MFGYRPYRTSKYDKAVMCVGKGDDGKNTFLKLFEHCLGLRNISHASLQMPSCPRSIAERDSCLFTFGGSENALAGRRHN
jgi:phage/plasmid-associated DNA primase